MARRQEGTISDVAREIRDEAAYQLRGFPRELKHQRRGFGSEAKFQLGSDRQRLGRGTRTADLWYPKAPAA